MGKIANNVAAEYQDIWQRCLAVFFNWSGNAVQRWSESVRKSTFARRKTSLLDHEDPIYYVRPLCIPAALSGKIGPKDRVRLLADIDRAIKGDDAIQWDDEQFDWKAARNRVDALLLSQFGEHLPEKIAVPKKL